MNYIFVDFEMNFVDPQYKAIRSMCGQEIIEFGAVMLNESLDTISTYKSYVRPDYSIELRHKITDLTGITDKDVYGAPSISYVVNDFAKWCNKYGEEYTVFAWSEHDLDQLTKELKLKNIEVNDYLKYMFDTWVDFQAMYSKLVGSNNPIALSKALDSIGIEFEGKMHDALWDAANTAELYKATRNPDEFKKMKNYITEFIKPKGKLMCSLGNLFNFDMLQLAES